MLLVPWSSHVFSLKSSEANHDSRINSAELSQNSIQSNNKQQHFKTRVFALITITYESCFTGKVNTYSCERTMKEYVHGLLTTEVEINWTSDCTQLYFVESIGKNFVLTDGTGSYCNGGLHSLFTSRSGLRCVYWALLWWRNAGVTTWPHLRSCRM